MAKPHEVECPECGHPLAPHLPEGQRSGSQVETCEACDEQFVIDWQRIIKWGTRIIRPAPQRTEVPTVNGVSSAEKGGVS